MAYFGTRLSIVQNIDALCLSRRWPLRNEFDELYRSLFKHAERHEQIVRALGRKLEGLSQQEIVKATDITQGGTLASTLADLDASGFIRRYHAYGKRDRDSTYQLIDPLFALLPQVYGR